jgi:hypothetical protein
VQAVDVKLKDDDVVLLHPEPLDHGLPAPLVEQCALKPLHLDAKLVELAVAEGHADSCLCRHLQHPSHLLGNVRWHR